MHITQPKCNRRRGTRVTLFPSHVTRPPAGAFSNPLNSRSFPVWHGACGDFPRRDVAPREMGMEEKADATASDEGRAIDLYQERFGAIAGAGMAGDLEAGGHG